MADVGLGQLVTATGRRRSKVAKDAARDNLPVMQHMEEAGGVRRVSGGRTVVEEALSDQNDTVNWVGARGRASLAENNVLDAAEFGWFYLLGSVVFDLAEQYMNEGPEQYVPLIKSKFKVLETTQMNKFHEGLLSNGTGVGGLQMAGLASHVSTTPSSGTVGGILRSSSDAAWFRNDKFDTAADWSDGAVDAGNVTRFLDAMVDATTINSKPVYNLGLLGQTHWGYLASALRATVQITHDKDSARFGHNKIWYRGIPMYLSGGLNYSGFTAQTATRSYLLNVEEGGFNVVFHKKAEFDMLEPVNSSDQAMISRLMFTMATCTIGAFAGRCSVGFD